MYILYIIVLYISLKLHCILIICTKLYCRINPKILIVYNHVLYCKKYNLILNCRYRCNIQQYAVHPAGIFMYMYICVRPGYI